MTASSDRDRSGSVVDGSAVSWDALIARKQQLLQLLLSARADACACVCACGRRCRATAAAAASSERFAVAQRATSASGGVGLSVSVRVNGDSDARLTRPPVDGNGDAVEDMGAVTKYIDVVSYSDDDITRINSDGDDNMYYSDYSENDSDGDDYDYESLPYCDSNVIITATTKPAKTATSSPLSHTNKYLNSQNHLELETCAAPDLSRKNYLDSDATDSCPIVFRTLPPEPKTKSSYPSYLDGIDAYTDIDLDLDLDGANEDDTKDDDSRSASKGVSVSDEMCIAPLHPDAESDSGDSGANNNDDTQDYSMPSSSRSHSHSRALSHAHSRSQSQAEADAEDDGVIELGDDWDDVPLSALPVAVSVAADGQVTVGSQHAAGSASNPASTSAGVTGRITDSSSSASGSPGKPLRCRPRIRTHSHDQSRHARARSRTSRGGAQCLHTAHGHSAHGQCAPRIAAFAQSALALSVPAGCLAACPARCGRARSQVLLAHAHLLALAKIEARFAPRQQAGTSSRTGAGAGSRSSDDVAKGYYCAAIDISEGKSPQSPTSADDLRGKCPAAPQTVGEGDGDIDTSTLSQGGLTSQSSAGLISRLLLRWSHRSPLARWLHTRSQSTALVLARTRTALVTATARLGAGAARSQWTLAAALLALAVVAAALRRAAAAQAAAGADWGEDPEAAARAGVTAMAPLAPAATALTVVGNSDSSRSSNATANETVVVALIVGDDDGFVYSFPTVDSVNTPAGDEQAPADSLNAAGATSDDIRADLSASVAPVAVHSSAAAPTPLSCYWHGAPALLQRRSKAFCPPQALWQSRALAAACAAEANDAQMKVEAKEALTLRSAKAGAPVSSVHHSHNSSSLSAAIAGSGAYPHAGARASGRVTMALLQLLALARVDKEAALLRAAAAGVPVLSATVAAAMSTALVTASASGLPAVDGGKQQQRGRSRGNIGGSGGGSGRGSRSNSGHNTPLSSPGRHLNSQVNGAGIGVASNNTSDALSVILSARISTPGNNNSNAGTTHSSGAAGAVSVATTSISGVMPLLALLQDRSSAYLVLSAHLPLLPHPYTYGFSAHHPLSRTTGFAPSRRPQSIMRYRLTANSPLLSTYAGAGAIYTHGARGAALGSDSCVADAPVSLLAAVTALRFVAHVHSTVFAPDSGHSSNNNNNGSASRNNDIIFNTNGALKSACGAFGNADPVDCYGAAHGLYQSLTPVSSRFAVSSHSHRTLLFPSPAALSWARGLTYAPTAHHRAATTAGPWAAALAAALPAAVAAAAAAAAATASVTQSDAARATAASASLTTIRAAGVSGGPAPPRPNFDWVPTLLSVCRGALTAAARLHVTVGAAHGHICPRTLLLTPTTAAAASAGSVASAAAATAAAAAATAAVAGNNSGSSFSSSSSFKSNASSSSSSSSSAGSSPLAGVTAGSAAAATVSSVCAAWVGTSPADVSEWTLTLTGLEDAAYLIDDEAAFFKSIRRSTTSKKKSVCVNKDKRGSSSSSSAEHDEEAALLQDFSFSTSTTTGVNATVTSSELTVGFLADYASDDFFGPALALLALPESEPRSPFYSLSQSQPRSPLELQPLQSSSSLSQSESESQSQSPVTDSESDPASSSAAATAAVQLPPSVPLPSRRVLAVANALLASLLPPPTHNANGSASSYRSTEQSSIDAAASINGDAGSTASVPVSRAVAAATAALAFTAPEVALARLNFLSGVCLWVQRALLAAAARYRACDGKLQPQQGTQQGQYLDKNGGIMSRNNTSKYTLCNYCSKKSSSKPHLLSPTTSTDSHYTVPSLPLLPAPTVAADSYSLGCCMHFIFTRGALPYTYSDGTYTGTENGESSANCSHTDSSSSSSSTSITVKHSASCLSCRLRCSAAAVLRLRTRFLAPVTARVASRRPLLPPLATLGASFSAATAATAGTVHGQSAACMAAPLSVVTAISPTAVLLQGAYTAKTAHALPHKNTNAESTHRSGISSSLSSNGIVAAAAGAVTFPDGHISASGITHSSTGAASALISPTAALSHLPPTVAAAAALSTATAAASADSADPFSALPAAWQGLPASVAAPLVHLVGLLTARAPRRRPAPLAALQHPLFWPAERKAAFLVHVSNLAAARPSGGANSGNSNSNSSCNTSAGGAGGQVGLCAPLTAGYLDKTSSNTTSETAAVAAAAAAAASASAAALSLPLPCAAVLTGALERGAGLPLTALAHLSVPPVHSSTSAHVASAISAVNAVAPVGWLQATTPPSVLRLLLSSRPFTENSIIETLRFVRNREAHSKDAPSENLSNSSGGGSSSSSSSSSVGATDADSGALNKTPGATAGAHGLSAVSTAVPSSAAASPSAQARPPPGQSSFRELVGSGSATAGRMRFVEARLPLLLLSVYTAAAATLLSARGHGGRGAAGGGGAVRDRAWVAAAVARFAERALKTGDSGNLSAGGGDVSRRNSSATAFAERELDISDGYCEDESNVGSNDTDNDDDSTAEADDDEDEDEDESESEPVTVSALTVSEAGREVAAFFDFVDPAMLNALQQQHW